MSKLTIQEVKDKYCFMHPKTLFNYFNTSRCAQAPKGIERGEWKDSYYDIYIDELKSTLNYSLKSYMINVSQPFVELDDESALKIVEQLQVEAELNAIVSEFNAKLAEAENLASKYKLEFDISPAYGMGGYFDGEKGEWHPSSQSC